MTLNLIRLKNFTRRKTKRVMKISGNKKRETIATSRIARQRCTEGKMMTSKHVKNRTHRRAALRQASLGESSLQSPGRTTTPRYRFWAIRASRNCARRQWIFPLCFVGRKPLGTFVAIMVKAALLKRVRTEIHRSNNDQIPIFRKRMRKIMGSKTTRAHASIWIQALTGLRMMTHFRSTLLQGMRAKCNVQTRWRRRSRTSIFQLPR